MSKGDYERDLKHRALVHAKKQRLAGLRDLYGTYEMVGLSPTKGSEMRKIRAKIHSIEAQLRVMANTEGTAL